nr:MAG TPA: hypothetical protein [Caudoviricetes sp.]
MLLLFAYALSLSCILQIYRNVTDFAKVFRM